MSVFLPKAYVVCQSEQKSNEIRGLDAIFSEKCEVVSRLCRALDHWILHAITVTFVPDEVARY